MNKLYVQKEKCIKRVFVSLIFTEKEEVHTTLVGKPQQKETLGRHTYR